MPRPEFWWVVLFFYIRTTLSVVSFPFSYHFPIIFMATVWPAKNTILINFKIISSKAKLMTRIFYLLWSGAFKYSSFWVSNSSTRCFNKAKLNRVQMAKVNPEIVCCTQRNRGLVWIEEFKKRRPRLLYFYFYMFYKALSSTWFTSHVIFSHQVSF